MSSLRRGHAILLCIVRIEVTQVSGIDLLVHIYSNSILMEFYSTGTMVEQDPQSLFTKTYFSVEANIL